MSSSRSDRTVSRVSGVSPSVVGITGFRDDAGGEDAFALSQSALITEPAVSVIISTRDRAYYLPEVLRTLIAQECEVPFEIVVIDNGSTDGTAELLQEWCTRDPRIRTAREPRPGLSRGKNAGIRTARAPLLLFTDDDVQVHPRWVAAYYELFSRNGADTPLLA